MKLINSDDKKEKQEKGKGEATVPVCIGSKEKTKGVWRMKKRKQTANTGQAKRRENENRTAHFQLKHAGCSRTVETDKGAKKALCEKCLTFSQIQKERWRKNVKIVRSIKQSPSLLKQYKAKKAKVPITDKKYCSQIRQQNEEGFRHNMGVLEKELRH